MDIKERIGKLSEAEAKSALESVLHDTTRNCALCPHVRYCVEKLVEECSDECLCFRLDDALRRYDDGHKGTD